MFPFEQKKQLRSEVRLRKSQFSAEMLAEKSRCVIAQLEADALFRAAHTVMLYWSLPDEVCTHALIAHTLGKKRIILPVVAGDDIRPVELHTLDDLHEGAFHIQEPTSDAVFSSDIDLIVLPGMAFSPAGDRLGRGRGYYDRFLAEHAAVPTIGLAFDFQIFPHIPTEPHDAKIGKVLF